MSGTMLALRYAMDIWFIALQTLPIDWLSHSPSLLARLMLQDCRLLYGSSALVKQIGCSRSGQLGVYTLYVKFERPPDPDQALIVFRKICITNNAIHFDVSSPLNYEEPVKLPFIQSIDGIDVALARIRENTPKIIAGVATGSDLFVIDV